MCILNVKPIVMLANSQSAGRLATVMLTLLLIFITHLNHAQNLYTARGYWEESNKPAYRAIKDKQTKNEALTTDEQAYMTDFEAYLSAYFNRLTPEEKQKYLQMKDQWDRELNPLIAPQPPQQLSQQQQIEQAEFEWRNRDRFINFLYGTYYGASLIAILDTENAAAVGIPLITGGVWLLGPAMNPKKYEGITQTTVNASNTGKFLGLLNGWSLALAVAGESDGETLGKLGLGISTASSIALGELAFQTQKKKNISAGRVEMIRHYCVLGPLVGASVLASTNTENANMIGVGLLAGSAAGLLIGNRASKQYDYTQGDVNVVSSLSLISTGLGFAIISDAVINGSNPSQALILIPAGTAVAGTLLGQRMVRGAHLTKKQGSTVSLSSLGGALVGVGVLALVETDSPIAWFSVPSVMALVMHQAVLSKYKRDNLVNGLKGLNHSGKKVDFSMKLMPENYFVSKQISPEKLINNPSLAAASPLVNVSLKFK
jgi:hypothetical protein